MQKPRFGGAFLGTKFKENTKMLMRYTHLRAEDLVGRLG
jgi:hypothetical protein